MGADPRNDARPGFQFSVKHYLTLNVVLGLLLVVRPAEFEPSMANSLVMAAIIAVCAAALILGAAWASLSPGRPGARLLVVLLLAVLTGFLPPYYFRMSAADPGGLCCAVVASGSRDDRDASCNSTRRVPAC